MFRHNKLKRFARTELERLKARFPYYDMGDGSDPEKINAIYPKYEWQADGPAQDLTERRDWQHIFGVEPSSVGGDTIEVFFERLHCGLAVAWARLKINGRTFHLKEQCYKDHSDVSTAVYSGGGIRLECHGPLRFWRVAINAIFIEVCDEQNEKTYSQKIQKEVHVKLGARISMMSHPFEIPKQCPPSMLARIFKVPNLHEQDVLDKAKSSIAECCRDIQAILQALCWYCEIIVDGTRTEHLLFGCRLKFLGKSNLLQNVRHYAGYAENATVFHLMELADGKCYGYCFNPTFYDKPISKGRSHRNQNNGRSSIELTFNAASHIETYPHTISLVLRDQVAAISTLNANDASHAWLINDFDGELVRGKKAEQHKVSGLFFELPGEYRLPPEKLQMCALVNSFDSESFLVLSTTERSCRSAELTGGKGSSLASLTAIAQYLQGRNEKDLSFTVPPAVVLTVKAQEAFNALPTISQAMLELEKTTENSGGQLDLSKFKTASEKCVTTISQVTLPAALELLLFKKLAEIFGANWEIKRFAVRSSAVGEDSQEMSAAGQMATYLGVTGKSNISEAVVKCWASQFALTAINYKRQYGQRLAAPMAVVVQEMAKAQCAGVMFTCDPVTAHPGRVVLSGNFGLGESVVSATAEPDTFTLAWASAGTTSGQLPSITLLNKTLGTKGCMTVLSEHAAGVEEVQLSMDEAQKFCLKDEDAVRIAAIGIKVTQFTDTPRDIEWAMVNREIVLLQSRPVSSFLGESDFETKHDLNSALYSNREILHRGNYDEVMPGVFSPMGVTAASLIFDGCARRAIDAIFPNMMDRSQYTYTDTLIIGRKCFMSLSINPFAKNKGFLETTQHTMFGYDFLEHEALTEGIYHEKKSSKSDTLKTGSILLRAVRNLEKTLHDARDYAKNAKIDVARETDSLSILLRTFQEMPNVQDCLLFLMNSSLPAGLFYMMILNILKTSQGEKEVTSELMVLISKLLRSDYEVESAQIPKDLMRLSSEIRASPRGAEFAEMVPEDGLKFLNTDDTEAGNSFRRFLSQHGHRCYKEFDVHSKTWDIDPTLLISTLQASVRAGEQKIPEEEAITIANLEHQPSFIQRKLLNYLLPRAKLAVCAREASKSVVIKCIHQLRLALRRLGQQLQTEGRIPDAELVFFFTIDEVYRLITTRNPSLISRGIRRMRIHSQLDKQKFDVLSYGMPKPIELDTLTIPDGAGGLLGTPVSQGIVIGPARVVHDFENEAHLIKKGDILVTHATDTGWTPYFPLLSGVITELGGLLSHGAVVAREYGLPAIVGVVGATDFFHSDEIITLDGNKGHVAKQKPNDIS